MVSYFGSVWYFECSLNVSIWWVTLEAFDALNVPWMLANGELLWKRLRLWMFHQYSTRLSYFGTVLGFECLLNVSIWWVTLEAFDALNAPWILTYVELLWKCLMLWMFLNCLHMVSYFGSVWCFKCSLNVSIWWVSLEVFDALNVP